MAIQLVPGFFIVQQLVRHYDFYSNEHTPLSQRAPPKLTKWAVVLAKQDNWKG